MNDTTAHEYGTGTIGIHATAQRLLADRTEVAQVMTTPVPACGAGAPVDAMASALRPTGHAWLVVLDEAERPVGLVTLDELEAARDASASRDARRQLVVGDVMCSVPVWLPHDTSIGTAARILSAMGTGVVAVVIDANGELAGTLSMRDLI